MAVSVFAYIANNVYGYKQVQDGSEHLQQRLRKRIFASPILDENNVELLHLSLVSAIVEDTRLKQNSKKEQIQATFRVTCVKSRF